MKKRIGLIFLLMLALAILISCGSANSGAGDAGEKTPSIAISEDGYWVINGEKTNVLAGTIASEVGTKGLAYYPKDDGTYAVGAGTTMYLSEIVIPSTYQGRAVTEIAERGFEEHKLRSVTIPDSVTSIGERAFIYCNNLTSVVIGDSVETLGAYAFADCDQLSEITLGESLVSIGGDAFFCCYSLTSIKYRGTEEQWNAISKESGWNSITGSYTITYNYVGE